MNIKTAIAISVAGAILLITPVLAEDSTSTAKSTTQPRVGTRTKLEQRKLTEASKAAMFRQKLEERRLRIASHEAEIKLKIQAFRDKQKAEIAARVNSNLNKINKIQTDQLLRNLDLMSQLLDKLAQRDPALANQAIADAREAIAKARTAVETQAQKDYTIALTTEAKVRLDAQAKRDQLHTDILAVRKLVIGAKQAVSNAVRVAKSGKVATPGAKIKEGSSSGKQ